MKEDKIKRKLGRLVQKTIETIAKVISIIVSKVISGIIKLLKMLPPQVLIGLGIIAAVIIIVVVVYLVYVGDGTRGYGQVNVGNTVSQTVTSEITPKNIVKKDSGGYGFNIDLDEKVKKVKEDLKEEKLLDEYISQENQDEYLKNFIKADIKTRYPDLRSKNKIGTELAENEVQGAIQIYRKNADNTDNVIEYIDEETFNKYIDENNKKAINYFTLNEYGNLVISSWTRKTNNDGTEEYYLAKETIDYRPLVKRYDMPFDFLWALTVMGEDEELSNEVSLLTKNTKIEITIYEDVTKTITVTETIDPETQNVTATTEKYEECKNSAYLTYADTWLAEVKNEYVNTTSKNVSTEASSDGLKTTTKTVEINKYIKGDTTITEKVKTDTDEDNFITLLKKHETAQNSILTARDWFYEMLESSEDTVDMIDTIDYLLDIVEGKNTTGNIIAEGSKQDITQNQLVDDIIVDTTKGNDNLILKKEQLEEIIKKTYKDTDDKQKNLLGALDSFYKIQSERHVNAVFAIAVAIQESNAGTSWNYIDKSTHNWMSVMGQRGYTDKNGNTWKKYESFSEATEDFGRLIETNNSYFAGGNITVKQISKAYCSPSEPWSNHVILKMKDLYSSIGIHLDDYIDKKEEENSSEDANITATTFLGIAKQCHDYIKDNNFYYVQGNKIPYPNGTSYIDCSAYVTWVLYEYGYTEFAGHQKDTAWFMGSGPSKMGWTILKPSEAKAGDLLVKSGHIEIFAGDGVGTYSAGSTNSIRKDISYKGCSLSKIISDGGFTRAIRVKAPN